MKERKNKGKTEQSKACDYWTENIHASGLNTHTYTHRLKLFTINAGATASSAAASPDTALWQMKIFYTHYHNHHHDDYLLFTALAVPLQFISAQNKSGQIDCHHCARAAEQLPENRLYRCTWRNSWLFCVCVCVCTILLPWVFSLGRSAMLVISNLLWFQSPASCISTVWGLNSCHWHRSVVYILWVYASVSVCILTF